MCAFSCFPLADGAVWSSPHARRHGASVDLGAYLFEANPKSLSDDSSSFVRRTAGHQMRIQLELVLPLLGGVESVTNRVLEIGPVFDRPALRRLCDCGGDVISPPEAKEVMSHPDGLDQIAQPVRRRLT